MAILALQVLFTKHQLLDNVGILKVLMNNKPLGLIATKNNAFQ